MPKVGMQKFSYTPAGKKAAAKAADKAKAGKKGKPAKGVNPFAKKK